MDIKEFNWIVRTKRIRNIHPVKIDPSRVEGALKLIITKYWSKSSITFSRKKIL